MPVPENISTFIPDVIRQELIERAREFNAQNGQPKDPLLEEEIAMELARASHEFFGSVPYPEDETLFQDREQSPFYTPSRAQQEGIGNCFAHATTIGKVATHPVVSLSVRSLWNGEHSTNIWITPRNIWKIDGEMLRYTALFTKTADVTRFSFADIAYGGRFYYHLYPPFSAGIREELAFEEAPAKLGNHPTSFPQSRLVLPIHEAEIMFKAIGDKKRYLAQGRNHDLSMNAERFDQLIPLSKNVPDLILPTKYIIAQGLKTMHTER